MSFSFRFPYSVSRSSGVRVGLDGAVQRLVVNGNSIEHLMEHATDTGGEKGTHTLQTIKEELASFTIKIFSKASQPSSRLSKSIIETNVYLYTQFLTNSACPN